MPPYLSARKGPYLPAENANAVRLDAIYGTNIAPFVAQPVTGTLRGPFVLCDVYSRQMVSGQKTGMPILYYKANTAEHTARLQYPVDCVSHDEYQQSGEYLQLCDNQQVLDLGKPWSGSSGPHELATPTRFGQNIRNEKVSTWNRPARADSYILMSAGWDGEYGTADDVCNFEWKYRE